MLDAKSGESGLGQGGATTAGSSTVGGATSLAAGGSTSQASGGSSAAASSLRCPSGLVIADEDVISDFNTADQTAQIADLADPYLFTKGQANRGNTAWFGDFDPAQGASNEPLYAASQPTLMHDTTQFGGTCSPGGAMMVASPGNVGYGTGFGVSLLPLTSSSLPKRVSYDASEYTGVGFFMRCSADVDLVDAMVLDANNDGLFQVPRCATGGDPSVLTPCNPYGLRHITVTKDWSYYRLYFSELLQDPTLPSGGKAFDARETTALTFRVNTKSYRNSSVKRSNGYACYIDDVHFLRDVAPSESRAVLPKPCIENAADAAPGGYYTTAQSNQIWDCKTGQSHLFKGIARASLEWDPAGRNITYADLSRIAGWNANVVRYSLNQAFWLDNEMGPIYQAYVDRAVKWTLALSMDVILELHQPPGAVNAMPDSESHLLWSQVAERYANEGRVSFELFNEPAAGGSSPSASDWDTWHDAMQSLVDTVRAKANNLVLVGGLNEAFDLSGAKSRGIVGNNIAYVAHPFTSKLHGASAEAEWNAAFGEFAQSYPVVATAFGQAAVGSREHAATTLSCDSAVYSKLIAYFSEPSHPIGWTGWAWYVDTHEVNPEAESTCGFPQLITSYDGTTNAAGAIIKEALK